MLGLYNLSKFSRTQKCFELYEKSLLLDKPYPFAATSLQMTLLAAQIVEIGQLGFTYWSSGCEGEI